MPGTNPSINLALKANPELVAARFPADAPLIGAIALAADAATDRAAAKDGAVPVSAPE